MWFFLSILLFLVVIGRSIIQVQSLATFARDIDFRLNLRARDWWLADKPPDAMNPIERHSVLFTHRTPRRSAFRISVRRSVWTRYLRRKKMASRLLSRIGRSKWILQIWSATSPRHPSLIFFFYFSVRDAIACFWCHARPQEVGEPVTRTRGDESKNWLHKSSSSLRLSILPIFTLNWTVGVTEEKPKRSGW